jgi:hypothetical protein
LFWELAKTHDPSIQLQAGCQVVNNLFATSLIYMSKKFVLTLSLLTSALLAGVPTLAAPTDPAPAPQTPSQTPSTPDTQPQTPLQAQPKPAPRNQLPSTPAQPSSSSGLLTKADLPSGFQEVPPELKSQVISQLGTFIQQQMPGATLKPENLAGFFNPETSEVVMSYTDKLSNQSSQAQLDNTLKQIQQPQTRQKLLGQLQAQATKLKDYQVEVVDLQPIAGLSNLADSSAGMAINLKIQGQPVLAHIVTFRRNATAAIAAVGNLNGQQPSLKLGDIAGTIDKRLQSSPAANRSQLTPSSGR